jgi:hypothetical protein
LWCKSKVGIIEKNNLAKFGYIIEKIRFLLYSWLLSRSCHKTLAIWNFLNSKSVKCGPFFPWKVLCTGQNHVFWFKILPVKETLFSTKYLAWFGGVHCGCGYINMMVPHIDWWRCERGQDQLHWENQHPHWYHGKNPILRLYNQGLWVQI